MHLNKLQNIKTYKSKEKPPKYGTNSSKRKDGKLLKKSSKLSVNRKKKAFSKGHKKLKNFTSDKVIEPFKKAIKEASQLKEPKDKIYVAIHNNHFINAKYKNSDKPEKKIKQRNIVANHQRHKSNLSYTKKTLSKDGTRHKKNNSLIVSLIARDFKQASKKDVITKNKKSCIEKQINFIKNQMEIHKKHGSEISKKRNSEKVMFFEKNNNVIKEESEEEERPVFSIRESPKIRKKSSSTKQIKKNPIKNYFFNLNHPNKKKKKKTKSKVKFNSAIENLNSEDNPINNIKLLSNRKANKLHPRVLAEFKSESFLELVQNQKNSILENEQRKLPRFTEIFTNINKDKESDELRQLKKLIENESNDNNKVLDTTLQFYQIIKLLGKGSFGKVYLGLQKLTNRLVAIKCLEKSNFKDETTKKKILTEVKILKATLGHPNVVKLLEVFENKKYVFFVTEYATNGDLLKYLKKNNVMPEKEAKYMFYQIAYGLSFIHSQSIIHRDIKLDNILVDEHNRCKICDFGVSREIDPNETINEQCGTPAYLAPEIIKDEGYKGFKADIWSLGVLLYSLLTGNMPFKAGTIDELHKKIVTGDYTFPDDCCISVNAIDIVQKMLVVDPEQRIDIKGVLNHTWLKSINLETTTIFNIKEFEKRQDSYLNEFVYEINDFALARITELGFAKELVEQAVYKKELNHASACYFNIEKDFI